MKYTSLKIIPMPKEVIGEKAGGGFELTSIEAKLYCADTALFSARENLFSFTKKIHGVELSDAKGGITLSLDTGLADGEYKLEITEGSACVYASGTEGANYAAASLIQLMRPLENGKIELPLVTVSDKPDCDFRALMVDLARQWHPFHHLYFYVDLCALYKIKYLHLHFIDTQSYTLPSRKFPKMSTPGCHYSFEDIKILCDYAELRGVELIPEIELPGHSQAMVKAYPEIFRNTPDGEVAVDDYSLFNNTDEDNIICIGKEGVMDALREILTELAEMFPKSKYIHIGGDEATITDWAHCRDCKRYMQEHGINGVKALYSHCVKEITDIVLDIGRTPIVWEGFPREGAEQISKDVVVIAWESYYLTAPDLIDLGFKIINASWQPLYIIPYERAEGRLFWGAKDILEWNIYTWINWNRKTKAYLNPIHIQPTEQVIGGLFCSWECVYEQEADRIRENLAALSERTWNIRRYTTDAQFYEKLSGILPLTEKLSPEE